MSRSENILIETRSPTDTSSNILAYFITFSIGLSFILIQTKWGISAIDPASDVPGNMPGIVGVNNLQEAIGKALLGLVGAFLLVLPSHTKYHYRFAPLFFFSGYLLFCFSSVIWSTNTDLTLRRLLVLFIFLVGILGTVRHLSTRQLLDTAIVVALVLISLGLAAEVSHGRFAPLLSYYRFSGTMHPNSQGAICAILVIAAYCGLRQAGSNKMIYLAALVVGIVFLYLTKSRSNIVGCTGALYLTSFWKSSFRTKQLLVLIPIVLVSTIILMISFTNPDQLGDWDDFINIGRDLNTYDILSLHGRVPLWIFLKDYIFHKPLLGYGYHGFWTPQIIATFDPSTLTWAWFAESAHSVIIDLLLQVGFLGGLFYAGSVLTVLYWAVKDCSRTGKPEAFFTFSVIVYAMVVGFLESNFLYPQSFVAFIISIALFNCCIIKEKKFTSLL